MTTGEWVHLVTGSYFRSRNEDGGHAIRSAVAECCAARKLHRFMCYRSELLVDKFNARESGYVLQRRFTKCGEITQNKKYYAVQGHSRSPILVLIESSCDFLLVINCNLLHILHRFQVIDYWSNFR